MPPKQKLELTWIGKENRPRLEPRVLVEDPALSYHAAQRVSDVDLFDNRLIRGDNLLALKALEQEFAGSVKCICIDPPYNTGNAFSHYDDGVEHSLWLTLMRDRLELLKNLLAYDGSIWIFVDDNEAHYLRVLCDEVFGRANFIATIVWQKRTSRENRAVFSVSHDYIFVFAKMEPSQWRRVRNRLPSSEEGFSNPDKDVRGPWRSVPFSAQGFRPNQVYKILSPAGEELDPPRGRCWAATEPVYLDLLSQERIYFPNGGTGRPRIKVFAGQETGLVPETLWMAKFAGDNEAAKKEILELYPEGDPFPTPKPERVVQRILEIATNPGDLVLDSFAGSGTTGAVAHKMGRRWIMVELGDHCETHIVPRLKKVIDGEDKGGVTEATGWKGGGGFRYYTLAPSLLETDRWGRLVISEAYRAKGKPELLVQALCKLEGFTYSPSETNYWQQAYSTERDFLYVTTQRLSLAQLQQLSEEVGEDRTLLVLCAAFAGDGDRWPNLTVRKIPQHIQERCDWGHDDYSLMVENLPQAPPEADAGAAGNGTAAVGRNGRKRGRVGAEVEASLFDAAPEAAGGGQ